MFARTLRQKSTTFAPSATRTSVLRNQTAKRFQSTASSTKASAQDAATSPLLAGAVGGLVTLTGGYAWYHLSGTSKVVNTAKTTINQLQSAKTTITESTPSRSEIVHFLRSNFSPYLTFIPGASAAFDELDEIAETHGDELNRVLSDAYNDLKAVLEKGGLDKGTAMKVGDIARRLAGELKELGKDVGQKILEDNPKLKEQIGGGMEQLKDLGRTYGPEAQKVVDETYKEVEEIISKGLSPAGIYKATQLVQEKTQQVKDLGRKAAEKAWEKGSDEAQQYLDKAPQLKKIVEENLDSIKAVALGGGLSVSQIPNIFQKIKDVATSGGDNKESIDRLKRYMEDLAKQGKSKMGGDGSDTWQSLITMVFKETPDVSEIMDMVNKKGPEAEKLAKETMEEISEVLRKKVDEAKKLAKEEKK
ncbi:hypothetical protein BZA05DRAFT_378794 [Tricharina praecox]|uniref:uncharacterized protein n=1 Tax=Tricharina praecox TaxID=43433 RepID=UPI0022204CA9|nr:uncharacterized protein BZA05DRAFT_378794 [Tricharina praecox]KAI5844346.1 hypothetical protein BZA05DRAFT_378794 [Tricharina praecox]